MIDFWVKKIKKIKVVRFVRFSCGIIILWKNIKDKYNDGLSFFMQKYILKGVIDMEISTVKVRKRPVIVEAYQTEEEIIIPTLEGDLKASKGDWIITGVNGEQYPCKPDIFDKTYDILSD